jgi:hypothetical protein
MIRLTASGKELCAAIAVRWLFIAAAISG